MVSIGTSFFTEESAGFVYIPSISLGYIFANGGSFTYFILSILCLISAVFHHGFIRAIGGSSGLNDLRRDEKIKRMQAAVWGIGGADEYPADLLEGLLNSPHRRRKRYPILLGFFLSNISLFVGFILATIYFATHINQIGFLGMLLFLLLGMWLLQAVLWKFWRSVHLKEERLDNWPDEKRLIRKEMHRFGYFIREEADFYASSVDYKPEDGGVFYIEFEADTDKIEVDKRFLETVSQAYVAFINRVNFPIERIEGYILYTDSDAVKFHIESSWAEDYDSGSIDYDTYYRKVDETLQPGEYTS